MTILVFWSITLGRRVKKPLVSDLQLKVKDFVEPIYIKGPISKRHENIQSKPIGLGQGFGGLYQPSQSIFYY